MGEATQPRELGGRRQIVGLDAIGRALAGAEPPRLIVHVRGASSPELSRLLDAARERGVPAVAVGARELLRMSADSPAPEALALLGPDPAVGLAELLARGGAVWLLSGTAFPGNAGFVIRTAEVSGAAGVTIDADFDRRARRDMERAAMRADRLLPVVFGESAEVVAAARRAGHRIVAIEDVGQSAPWQVDLTGDCLFVVGSEGAGVPDEILDRCDDVVRIPMAGFMPSYNLQAAMAAVAGERLRQVQGAEAAVG
jgi:tRNA G18 (ribose-2'-O)-methylase SpoU